jgi:class III poly(R)-hydroxyalkanoic acid synthase PhaE subunit
VQKLAQAQMDYQHQNSAYNALMMKAAQSAYEIFEQKLAERSEPGKQIETARALFDLWIDAAEEAYARIALSPEFRAVYGKLVNAQMRLRSGIQREVEQMSAMFGMPTRTEVDGAYRKIAELERSVRRLRDAAEGTVEGPTRAAAAKRDAGGKTSTNAKSPAGKAAPAKPAPPAAPKPAATRTRKR